MGKRAIKTYFMLASSMTHLGLIMDLQCEVLEIGFFTISFILGLNRFSTIVAHYIWFYNIFIPSLCSKHYFHCHSSIVNMPIFKLRPAGFQIQILVGNTTW